MCTSTSPATILRFRSRMAARLIFQLSFVIPNSSLRLKYDATFALWMMFLLGRHAMFGQEPPTYFRSITAVFIPFLASVQERSLPAAPLPRTSKSYSSALIADAALPLVAVLSKCCVVSMSFSCLIRSAGLHGPIHGFARDGVESPANGGCSTGTIHRDRKPPPHVPRATESKGAPGCPVHPA